MLEQTVFIETRYRALDFFAALVYTAFVITVSMTLTLSTQAFIFEKIAARDVFTLLVSVSVVTGIFTSFFFTAFLNIRDPYLNLFVFLAITAAVAALILYFNIEYYTKIN